MSSKNYRPASSGLRKRNPTPVTDRQGKLWVWLTALTPSGQKDTKQADSHPFTLNQRNSKSKLNLSLTEKKTLNGHLRQTDQTLPFTEEFLAFWNIFHQHFYGLSVRTHTYMITHLRFSFIFWAVSHLTFCSAWLFVCCLFCYVMMFSLFRACPVNQSCLSRHIMMNLRWAQSLIPKYVVQTVLVEAVLYLIELMQRIAVQ